MASSIEPTAPESVKNLTPQPANAMALASDSRPTVSAAVICLNEERDLPACLGSLTWCDEIVVVIDSRTTDRTPLIAGAAGARVFSRDWEGWSPQKNFAFAQCTGEWILSIDADERVPDDLRNEICLALDSPESFDGFEGYYMPRRNMWMGRWIQFGGWYPDYTLRIFRRGKGECHYMVHERIEVQGPVGVLQHALLHETIQSLDEHLMTSIRYTDAEAREMLANEVRFYRVFPFRPVLNYLRDLASARPTRLRAYLLAKQHFKNRVEVAWLTPFAPVGKFLHMYVIKQGYRDGGHGFCLATLSAIYVVLKYATYWAYLRKSRGQS